MRWSSADVLTNIRFTRWTVPDRPYRVLIEQIQEGAVTLTGDGIILYCNRRVADLLGTAQERVIGRSLQPHTLPDQQPLLDLLLAKGRQTRTRGEVIFCAADGAEVPILLSLSPMEAVDGPCSCAAC